MKKSGLKLAGVIVGLLSIALPFVSDAIQAKQYEEDIEEMKAEIKADVLKTIEDEKES